LDFLLRRDAVQSHAGDEVRQVRAEVDGGGGFAHSAFLIDEGVDASHFDFRFSISDLRLLAVVVERCIELVEM
jgi:hypothetical protein